MPRHSPSRAGSVASADELEWMEGWISSYGDRITRFAEVLCGSPEGAQDIAQETFFRLMVFHRRHPDRAILPGWLFTVARNLYHSTRRANKGVVLVDQCADLPGDADLPDDRLSVLQAMDQLPEVDRECLWLFYYGDLTIDEVARQLRISPGAVKGRLYRARDRFARVWRGEGNGSAR